MKDIQRIAAFADGDTGGNPAGVWIGPALPPADVMQRLACAVGYSETVFAAPQGELWRVPPGRAGTRRGNAGVVRLPRCRSRSAHPARPRARGREPSRAGAGQPRPARRHALRPGNGPRADGKARPDDDRAGLGRARAQVPHPQSVRQRRRLRGPGHGGGDGGAIDVVQGEDMGMRSLLRAEIGAAPGGSIRVSGMARQLAEN
jgi:hypothetical protein